MTIKDKLITIIILILMFAGFYIYHCQSLKLHPHKILKVVEADKYYIDLNDNNKIDNDELIKLEDVSAFYPIKNDFSLNQAKNLNLTIEEYLKLGFIARKWAVDNLTNKNVFIMSKLDEFKPELNYRYAYIKYNSYDLGEIILKNGLGFIYKDIKNKNYYSKRNYRQIKNNLIIVDKADFLLLNLKTNILHKLNSLHFSEIHYSELVLSKDAVKNFQLCKFCFNEKIKSEKINEEYNIPKSKNSYKKEVYKKFGNVEVYLVNPLEYNKPNSNCRTLICKRIVSEINSSKNNIDIALYGFGEQNEIYNALLKAKNRGVKINTVVDYSKNMDEIYPYTRRFINDFSSITDKSSVIMHNKFFIFDNKKVLTGSNNVSPSGTGGYNANFSILINSNKIAQSYKKEFNEMQKEKFSNKKQENPVVEDFNIKAYFSPKNNIYENLILPQIKTAKKEVFVSAFYLTDKNLINELIKLKKRGVNVLVLLDAVGANSFKDRVYMLRKENIPVIVENWGGKNHEKTILIDSNKLITGSANFSKSAFYKNDENVLLILNKDLALLYRDYYLYLFNSIDKKFLKYIPRAEGFDSKNTCYDGIDNNFDSKIDFFDEGCQKH